MNLRKVDARADATLLEEVRQLYLRSFPKEELLPWWLVLLQARRKGFALTAFLDGQELCGFTLSITGEGMHFLLFFAVAEQLRGQGYGSAILQMLKQEYGTVVLNIEPLVTDAPNPEERQRRYRFYRRNGFRDTGYYSWDVGGIFRTLSSSGRLDLPAFERLFARLTLGFKKANARKAEDPLYE